MASLPLVVIASIAVCRTASATAPALRCGWYLNPTPDNIWLLDADGQWIIAEQGRYEAKGDHPYFRDDPWVATNGPHGYGCACLRVRTRPRRREVEAILSARTRPLQACREDPRLPPPP